MAFNSPTIFFLPSSLRDGVLDRAPAWMSYICAKLEMTAISEGEGFWAAALFCDERRLSCAATAERRSIPPGSCTRCSIASASVHRSTSKVTGWPGLGKTTLAKLLHLRYPGQVFDYPLRGSTGKFDVVGLATYDRHPIILFNDASRLGHRAHPSAPIACALRATCFMTLRADPEPAGHGAS